MPHGLGLCATQEKVNGICLIHRRIEANSGIPEGAFNVADTVLLYRTDKEICGLRNPILLSHEEKA